ncbi:hypothetical protein GQ53DRAFT_707278 [Thozetella sp. PMI_491]|nr:hypothetical protein GQ53DRAFT_707278 [Thozetella sp. PMI_491]
MHLTSLVLLAGALGATAHPSHHAHLHREVHEKRDNVHYKAIHKVFTKTVTPTPATTTTPVAAPSSSSAAATGSSSGSGSTTYVEFCKGKSKRATAAEIAYTGNTGTSGDWGCNLMTVDSSIAHLYDYATTYTNVASESYEVCCFNKIGADGGINGFYSCALTFNLAPGASQVVVAEANSQGACAFAPGSIPKDPTGANAGSWVEFDFANAGNNNWSGADCSSLVAQAAGLSVPGCQVCSSSGTCSAILPGGQGINGYVKGMEAVDGEGINQVPGPFTMNVKVGYSG